MNPVPSTNPRIRSRFKHSHTSQKKMQETGYRMKYSLWPVFFMLLIIITNSGCKKSDQSPLQSSTPMSPAQNTIDMSQAKSRDFEPFNLVADSQGFNAQRVDPNINNAWGIAFGPNNGIRICSNHTGQAVLYNGFGENESTPVGIPFDGDPKGGAPTGVIYNNTSNFVIPGTGVRSQFIFCAEDGTISAWSSASGTTATTVADRSSSEAVYKGIAMARTGGANYLYATNFKQAKIDVFDGSFNYVTWITFTDPNLPDHYAPFGIQNIEGKLYVTFAKQKGPDNEDDQSGPGHGFVDIFNPDGSLVGRFASRGALNSPWGIAEVPSSNHAILIGNFGDGRINAFDASGNFLGALQDDRHDIVIEGLWGIAFPPASFGALSKFGFYYTAGPDDENHGLFGFIAKDDF